jgi:hypothetical protein
MGEYWGYWGGDASYEAGDMVTTVEIVRMQRRETSLNEYCINLS